MTRRTTRKRIPSVERQTQLLAASIGVPVEQRAGLVIVDVANHTEGEQRHSMRSKQTRTVKRTTKIDQLVNRRVLTKTEGAMCDWYRDRHTEGYETNGTTANYGDAGGSPGWRTFGLDPKYLEQEMSRRAFDAARANIDPRIVGMFENVVLHDRPLGRLTRTFRLAIHQLGEHLAVYGIAA